MRTKINTWFHTNSPSETSITLVNFISIVLSSAVCVLIAVRYVIFDLPPLGEFIFSGIIFLLPLLINYFRFYRLGIILICWLPPLVVLAMYIIQLKKMDNVDENVYQSFYIYFLSVSCTPFIVMKTKNKLFYLYGLSVPMIVLFFGDSIMNYFEVGPTFKGINLNNFGLNKMRAIIAYFVLGLSYISLRWFLEKEQIKNKELIVELEAKNKLIEENSQKDLQKATSRLALATQVAGIGLWEWDIETEELIWDERMYKLFDVDPNKQKLTDWRIFIHPEDLPELDEKVIESINKNIDLNSEFRIIINDKSIRYICVSGKIHNVQKQSTRMIGVCWDISKNKKTEELLIKSEANLNSTINNTNFYIWSVDRNFNILKFNKPFKHLLINYYNYDIKEGQNIEILESAGIIDFVNEWKKNITRALSGESFEINIEKFNRFFKHSFNPIIENAMITGVTVFTEERTDIINKEIALNDATKQISELKLMALRSAMNPHFIFNTLNSIQYFILRKDQLSAVNYLSTFSKLIRSILNNSVNSKIRLSEEIEQLQNYVQLESIRFENKFDFTIDIDEEIDVENIEISSMLIQPYLENSILHGLNNKVEKGNLKLTIKEDQGFILFEIEDDGIGREAASLNKSQSLSGHKSLGTSLTEERLRLITGQFELAPEIQDLYENGIASGTRVKVWVK